MNTDSKKIDDENIDLSEVRAEGELISELLSKLFKKEDEILASYQKAPND